MCVCTPGWTGTYCDVDVNECAQQQPAVCRNGGTCENTPGSFNCQCPTYYTGNINVFCCIIFNTKGAITLGESKIENVHQEIYVQLCGLRVMDFCELLKECNIC